MRRVRNYRPLLMAAALLISSCLPLAIAGCDSGAKNGSTVPVSDDAMKKKADILNNIRQQNIDSHKKGAGR